VIVRRESLQDIVTNLMPYLREEKTLDAETYLQHYVRSDSASERPALDYFLALVYAANGSLIDGRLDASGKKFRHAIETFKKDSRALEDIRDAIPAEFYSLQLYQLGKRKLGASISFSAKELYPIYAFLCLIERDYAGATWAAERARPFYEIDVRKKLATQLHACADRAHARKEDCDFDGLINIHDALLDKPSALLQHVSAVQADPSHQCSCLCSCHAVLH
ncbi:MAG TPA: hypothetical protein VLJ21_03845, partial [Candidatus Binatia bacterium]|nr:hypothetical protein [Candidatus Binatia bacterium]